MSTDTKESNQETLDRIQAGASKNDLIVVANAIDFGVAISEVIPRENVLTYRAWLAKGRQVRKGEHGLKLTVWVKGKDKVSGEPKVFPKTVTVFYQPQTDPAGAPKPDKHVEGEYCPECGRPSAYGAVCHDCKIARDA